MPRPIGIFGWNDDEQVAYMVDVLEHLGAETFVFDTRQRGGFDTWRWDERGIEGPRGERLEELGAVYVKLVALTIPGWSHQPLEGAELQQWCARYAEDRARRGFAEAVLRALEDRGIPLVNPSQSFWTHGAKAYAAYLLRRAGLRAPRTLVTADPQAVRAFVECVGEVVYKPAGGGRSCLQLEPADLEPERLELLRRAPCLFQELVPGDNIRVFVLDGEVVSSTIIWSESLDYREAEQGVDAVSLPAEVERQACAAAHAFGMVFTGIDIRRTPEGEHVFLDVNPAPMFVGFERGGGEDIGERLARHLLRLAGQRRGAAA
jgi:glutathione synthase/RimK-type ligase-like ATP-grasp enzyme